MVKTIFIVHTNTPFLTIEDAPNFLLQIFVPYFQQKRNKKLNEIIIEISCLSRLLFKYSRQISTESSKVFLL